MLKIVSFFSVLMVITFLQQYIAAAWVNSLISLITVALAWVFSKDRQFLENLYFGPLSKSKLLISCFASILLVVILHFSFNYFSTLNGYIPLQFQILNSKHIINLCVNILFFSLVEETIFRGYIQGEVQKMTIQLPKTLNLFYTIFIPAVLFGILHAFKMGPACLLIVIPGVFLGYLKLYSGSIYASIFAHFVFNFYYFNLLEPKPF